MRRNVAFLLPLLLVVLAAPAWPQAPQAPAAPVPRLSIEDVVHLSQSGFADDLIITKIKKNAKAFDLSTEELLELKKAGVSDQVVKYLLDPSLPYSGPPPVVAAPAVAATAEPEKGSSPAKVFPPDPLASQIPFEPGLYLIRDEIPLKIDIKLLLGENQGAGLGKMLMKKGKAIAFLPGAAAKVRIAASAPLFYMRLPEGKAIEEVLLIALQRERDRREVEAGTGAKQEFKAEAIRPTDSLEVGPRLYKMTPAKLLPGEYMFVLVGSAEPQKGTQGKAYDFAVDPAPAAKRAPKQ